jgi:hypothetical protein
MPLHLSGFGVCWRPFFRRVFPYAIDCRAFSPFRPFKNVRKSYQYVVPNATDMSSLTGFLFADDYNTNPVIARYHPPPSGKGKKMNDVWVQYKKWRKSEI